MKLFDKCQTNGCENMPAYRFTWPGRDEDGCCEVCARKLNGVASAMGMHLQFIVLPSIELASEPPATAGQGGGDG